MKYSHRILFNLLSILLLWMLGSCSQNWSKSLHNGSVEKVEFTETISFELVKGVIIMPVTIKGKTYRFLFDTGAVNSISEELQEELDFDLVTSGFIKDSDNNRKKVKYVNLDTIHIQGISFYNHTSFVGNFKANPVLRCMELDGILGSNIMRLCNWTIDYEKQVIRFTSEKIDHENKLSIPFQTDRQFNLLVDLKAGDKTIENIKIDYGSNGYISVPSSIFKVLKENEIIGKTLYRNGFSQSGIIGKTSPMKDEIGILDSLYYENISFKELMISSDGRGLLGSEILSQWIIDIDWDHRLLHFTAQELQENDLRTFGIGIGYTEDRGVYIQSVTEGSSAYFQGIKPHMKIIRIGEISFQKEEDFCQYIYSAIKSEQLDIELQSDSGTLLHYQLEKENLHF